MRDWFPIVGLCSIESLDNQEGLLNLTHICSVESLNYVSFFLVHYFSMHFGASILTCQTMARQTKSRYSVDFRIKSEY